jgi:predicted MFS family arabinose efflux permease
MATYSLLVGIGFIAAFPAVGQAVLVYGWRAAWLGVGVALVAVVAPLAAVILPGTNPSPKASEIAGSDAGGEAVDFTLGQALVTPAFWVFAFGSSLFGLLYSGIALFNESILVERGFDASTYHTTLVVSTMVGLAANFASGWLLRKISIQTLMAWGMALLAIALFTLPFVSSMGHVMAYALTMGIAGGVVTVVFFSVWTQVYGRAQLGRIQGAAQMMTVLASAAGPMLLARTLDQTGSYRSVFFVLGGLVVVAAFASWRVPLPAGGGRRAAGLTTP